MATENFSRLSPLHLSSLSLFASGIALVAVGQTRYFSTHRAVRSKHSEIESMHFDRRDLYREYSSGRRLSFGRFDLQLAVKSSAYLTRILMTHHDMHIDTCIGTLWYVTLRCRGVSDMTASAFSLSKVLVSGSFSRMHFLYRS